MRLVHDDLLKCVLRVNAAIALISWPFALYEAISKKAEVVALKANLDLKADQIISGIVARVDESLSRFWPRSSSRIVFDPTYDCEAPVSLSEAAKDALTQCLRGELETYARLSRMSLLSKKVLFADRAFYWVIFGVAILSIINLASWFFNADLSDNCAKLLIATPVGLALFALILAGIRQHLIHTIEGESIDDL